MSKTMACTDIGLLPLELAYAYGQAQSELLTVASYSEKIYEKTYRDGREEFARQPLSRAQCQSIEQQLPNMISQVRSRYAEIHEARMGALSAMSQSMAAYKPPAHYNYVTPQSSSASTFIQPRNSNRSYLVDLGQGQRICTVYSSGYVSCN